MAWYLSGVRGDGLALATAVACGVFIGRFMTSRQGGLPRPRPRPVRAPLQLRCEPQLPPGFPPVPRMREQPEQAAQPHCGPRYARSRAEAGQWQPAVAAMVPRQGAAPLAENDG